MVPPSNITPVSSANDTLEAARPHLQSPGPQMFSGAVGIEITGGNFSTVDQRNLTVNNSYTINVERATVSREDLRRLGVVDHRVERLFIETPISRIEDSIFQSSNNSATSLLEQTSSHHTTVSPPSSAADLEISEDHSDYNAQGVISRLRGGSIFYRSLITMRRGLPIWSPALDHELPISYRRKGISIGDVGLITERGSFGYLFNITLSIEHPDNPRELPLDFFPASLPTPRGIVHSTREDTPFRSIVSENVDYTCLEDQRGILFKSSASVGGIASFPMGFVSYDLRHPRSFRRHFSENGLKWYSYGLSQYGSRLMNGSLCLVIGGDHCRACGLAAFEATPPKEVELLFAPRQESEGIQTHQWTYIRGSKAHDHKTVPEARDIVELRGDEPSEQTRIYENLCVFVRTFHARVRDDIWDQLCQSSLDSPYIPKSASGNADYHSLGGALGAGPGANTATNSGGSDYRSSNSTHLSTMCDHGMSMEPHPSDTINEYLLKTRPNAKMAITGDYQWIFVLRKDESRVPRSEELIKRISDTYDILQDEKGLVFLEQKCNLGCDGELNSVEDIVELAGSRPLADNFGERRPKNYYQPDLSLQATAFTEALCQADELPNSPYSDTTTLDSDSCSTLRGSSGSIPESYQDSGGEERHSLKFSIGASKHHMESNDPACEPMRRKGGAS